MKSQKMSLANIQGKLSRAEMKNIMAGDGNEDQIGPGDDSSNSGWGTCCTPSGDCGGPGCRQWVNCNYIFKAC